jgi:hypothetical protein
MPNLARPQTAGLVRSGARALVVMAFAAIAGAERPALAQNLVPDPSLEAPVPSWFADTGGDCFADKQSVEGASDGRQVLAIQGWSEGGTVVWSRPFRLLARTVSATLDVRSFGPPGAGPPSGGKVELALYSADKNTKLAELGATVIDGAGRWTTIGTSGVKPSSSRSNVVLGLRVSGPMHGRRVEVDRLGLFADAPPSSVVDTAMFTWFEAEDMTLAGSGWQRRDHFDSWYQGFPSGMKMLFGASAMPAGDASAATRELEVPSGDVYALWVRFLFTSSAQYSGGFAVALKQHGSVVASKEIEDGDPQYHDGPQMDWVFTRLQARLERGPVEVVLTRPASRVWWGARSVDLFALTNLEYYKPKIQDFRPQGYVRFTNASAEAYCLWTTVFRNWGPDYGATGRMLTAAGLIDQNACPAGKALLPREPSPWAKISDWLNPGGGRNNVALLATTGTSANGQVQAPVKGLIEFALGNGGQVVKAIPVDQTAPRILLTLGYEFTPEVIKTASDYLAKELDTLAGIPSAARPRAAKLDLAVELGGLKVGVDRPDLIEEELRVAKGLGFNGTYTPIADPGDLGAFYDAHELRHVGIWGSLFAYPPGDMTRPDAAKMEAGWANVRKQFAPILSRVERAKVWDEPYGPSYQALLGTPEVRTRFRDWLRTQAVTSGELGAGSWDDVVPAGPEEAKSHPGVFYWTGLYRLTILADLVKELLRTKKAAGVPSTVRTYVNYAPTAGGTSFTKQGADPFFMQRNGGLELGWTEDWLAYGVSPEHLSDQLAVLRAAGAVGHEPLGAYVVGLDGPPALQRIRYYEALAAGARHIQGYAYGPYYNSFDSWGARYEVYPYISGALHDFGAIDSALDGTVRRKSDVAILYNRTAGIWAGENTATEQDSRYVFWALSHAGFQPDFVPEEDIEAGTLADYKVLYLQGVQLRRRAAAAITEWVANGGVLFATAGAGTRDEYDQPSATLESVFGAHSARFALFADAGRPYYEFRLLRPRGRMWTTTALGIPAMSFDRLCAEETLEPAADAIVIAQDDAGAPAAVRHAYGRGTALRVAGLPGLAYLHDAVAKSGYDPASYQPRAFRPALRDFITSAALLAKAEKVGTNAPTVEIVRNDAVDRSVLIVVNHGEPVPAFVMDVPDLRGTTAYSATGTPVTVSRGARGSMQLSFALDVADAVVVARTAMPAPPGAAVPPPPRVTGCVCSMRGQPLAVKARPIGVLVLVPCLGAAGFRRVRRFARKVATAPRASRPRLKR